MAILAPKSEQELLARCERLAGKTLGQLAAELGLDVPENLRRHKGWVGTLLEQALGADAGNRAQPDFTALDIELKTLPLNKLGEPKESTYVCTISMKQSGINTWQESWVRHKLAHVLWVPVEADSSIPLAQRYIGQAWLWQPSKQEEAGLQRDWEEIMDRIVLGEQDSLTAKVGEYLQIRPKGANNKIMVKGVSESGLQQAINPKGLYLRSCFTKGLLKASMKDWY